MNKPRCLITGSRHGLGLALYNEFIKDFDIIEYDIELGQDLNDPLVQDQLIEDLKGCTVFFNNLNIAQKELLTRAHELQSGLAIVISNSAVSYWTLLPNLSDAPEWIEYQRQKTILTKEVARIHDQQRAYKELNSFIMNLRLGWLNTEEHRFRQVGKMDPGDIAALIRHLLGLYPRVCVVDLVLGASMPLPAPNMLP
jgi:hypothetical protein